MSFPAHPTLARQQRGLSTRSTNLATVQITEPSRQVSILVEAATIEITQRHKFLLADCRTTLEATIATTPTPPTSQLEIAGTNWPDQSVARPQQVTKASGVTVSSKLQNLPQR
ncbi:hypothetical protein HBI64_081580 [Parastagonospora nodorum]|nr:hypothetical protein HBI06_099260 [Parastagonospora nodorum]KAH4235648.1 hypothetical protein HBI05_143320 [Parastagonospora nodorum]KAH4943013.1 hypothetical protein HBH73_150100 [Parastagonospora nodorum]KAH4985052.1 hypothetical protein HBI76_130850 [Parastagonospora nodorum]KAH5298447.1 hypothetical protein HBI11_154690 [Parastagonospora nodorum]